MAEQNGAQRRKGPEGTEPTPEPRCAGFLCPDVYRPAQSKALRPGDADILIWAGRRVREGAQTEARRASWESRGYQQWGRALSGFLSPS